MTAEEEWGQASANKKYIILALYKGERFPPADRRLVQEEDGGIREEWHLGVGDSAEPMIIGPYVDFEEAEGQRDELLLMSSAANMPAPEDKATPERLIAMTKNPEAMAEVNALTEAMNEAVARCQDDPEDKSLAQAMLDAMHALTEALTKHVGEIDDPETSEEQSLEAYILEVSAERVVDLFQIPE